MNLPTIEKYHRFIKDDDWSIEDVFDKIETNETTTLDYITSRYDRFELQHNITQGVVDTLKVFVGEYIGEIRKKSYKEFLEECKELIFLHTERCQRYIDELDLNSYNTTYIQKVVVEKNKEVFKKLTRIRTTLSDIHLSTEEEIKEIEFLKDNYAPLIMHEHIIKVYPEVKRKLDDMKIDFTSKPEPTFHIYNENPPQWESNKNYFDQEPDVLQYYVDELKKIRKGITIGKQYISGWMYYHINYFVTRYPNPNKTEDNNEESDIIGIPPLRDNEWWVINDNYELARKRGEMLFVAATRRAGKTTMNASHLGWALASGRMNLLVAGGSSTDLGLVRDNFNLLQQNIHTAFRVYGINEDWDKMVRYGVKLKNGKSIITSILKIVNLDAGADKKSEALAGFTPDAVIIDEIMKLPFKTQLAALKPAIESPSGKRCVVILTGTAGNEDLAKDAFDVLRTPSVSGVLNMPWDILNKRVPEEFRTWTEREFGTFIPAQMSAKEGMVKDKTSLDKYLKIKDDILSKVSIFVTNWEKAKDKINKDRDKLRNDLVEYTKEVLYFPVCPSDMLLSGKVNPFPVQEAIMHREYLLSIGGLGKKVYLSENTQGKIIINQNNDELASYPHKGGFIDCPVVLYEDLPDEMPPDNLYVAGFDDYKQEESGTDSIGSFHIYKVDAGFDNMCGKLVASYATRPDPHGKMHHQIYMLQRAFNAKCFMENADTDYQTFLELRRVADVWLVEAIDFDGEATQKSTGRRKYGWNPSSKKNRQKLMSLLIGYCKRVYEEEDGEGNKKTTLGVQNIPDIGVLDEIIAYKEGANVDRLVSFMSCLGYEFYLYCQEMFPSINRQLERRRDMNRDERNRSRKGSGSPFFNKNRKRKIW